MALTPVGGIAGKVILVGAGSLTAGSGTVDMAVGDEPGIPSYTGTGDMVTRGTDYELAGQAFDFGVGLLAPTGKLPSLLGTMGKRLDQESDVSTLFDGLGLVQSLSEEKPLQGTVFEGGIQAPDHRTRDDRARQRGYHKLGVAGRRPIAHAGHRLKSTGAPPKILTLLSDSAVSRRVWHLSLPTQRPKRHLSTKLVLGEVLYAKRSGLDE